MTSKRYRSALGALAAITLSGALILSGSVSASAATMHGPYSSNAACQADRSEMIRNGATNLGPCQKSLYNSRDWVFVHTYY